MQERILETHADADLRVYVVWMPVLPLDERFGVADVLVDPRARHFWDDEQRVSAEVGRSLGVDGLAWDMYLLYGPDAVWDAGLPAPLGTGAPVVARIGSLEAEIAPYSEQLPSRARSQPVDEAQSRSGGSVTRRIASVAHSTSGSVVDVQPLTSARAQRAQRVAARACSVESVASRVLTWMRSGKGPSPRAYSRMSSA